MPLCRTHTSTCMHVCSTNFPKSNAYQWRIQECEKGGARVWPNLLLLGVWGRCNCKPSNGVLGRAPQANAGMPNLRKNLFSTDFYRLFQSMDKEIIYGRIYGFLLTRFGHYPPPIALPRSQYSTEKKDFWTNLRICSYCVRLLPPPPTLDSRDFARTE